MKSFEDRMQDALDYVHQTMKGMSLKELAKLSEEGFKYVKNHESTSKESN